MPRAATVLVLLLLLLPCALPAARGADTNQYYANRIIGIVHTPQLSPGQAGRIEVEIFNPFNATMNSVTLNLSVYAYATTGVQLPLASIPSDERPQLGAGGTVAYANTSTLAPLGALYVNFTVRTTSSTRHGDFFNVGTYFVSTNISFHIGAAAMRMASRGVFSQSEWSNILVQGPGTSFLNYTYLNGTLGYQGITPDTSFTVDSPSPVYLLWVTGSLAALFAAIAFILHRNGRRHRP